MSKDLNNEYKKHIENEIPDLWNRIETALPSKYIDEPGAVESNPAPNVAGFGQEPPINENHPAPNVVEINTASRKRNRLRIYTGVLAACACLIACIPAVILFNRVSKSDEAASEKNYMMAESASEEAMADEAPVAAYDMEEAADSDYEMEEAEAAYDFAPSEAPAQNEEADKYEAEASENYESSAEAAVAADESESTMEQYRPSDEEMDELQEKLNGNTHPLDSINGEVTLLYNVRIRIKNIFVEDGKHFATVVILKDPEREFTAGDIVDVDISTFALDTGDEIQLPFAKNDRLTVDITKYTYNDSDDVDYNLLGINKFE